MTELFAGLYMITMNKLSLTLISVLLISITCYAEERFNGSKHPHKEWTEISLVPVVRGLKKPTHITHAGDNSGRLFLTEQKGEILIIKNNRISERPFLDIRTRVGCCGERGLLSTAFPEDYLSKKYFYVNYTNKKGNTVIARYRLTSNPDTADPDSEEILLTIRQPFSNHNGGQIAFGPDGYLYIGTGDGGLAGDPLNNGQDPGALLGKILRIDVESGVSPYAVPADNPFVKNKKYRPEIWALGLRNPWRFSFDRNSGDLYIADVGQDKYEEVSFQPSNSRGGENYGWSILEGTHCYGSSMCRKTGMVIPVAEYDHSQGCSITGGMVYRGKSVPSLKGIYLYSDYCSGRIWGLKKSGTAWLNRLLLNSGLSVSTFGENEKGDIFLADYGTGDIYRIKAK
jgi:glucose/arabinose dehydrogenase